MWPDFSLLYIIMVFGLLEGKTFRTSGDLCKEETFGPFIVDTSLEGKKLFQVCNLLFKEFTRGLIRYCFIHGLVIYNDRNVRKGHQDETIRVRENDLISITLTWDQIVLESDEYKNLQIVTETDFYTIIIKPQGISMKKDSFFDLCCRKKCWSAAAFESAISLFHLNFTAKYSSANL